MEILNLLIVEDDSKIIDLYERGIKAYNLDSEIKIESKVANNKDSALTILNNNLFTFDAAIVDLDLIGNGGDDRSGNEVIRLIKENLRFPVFVISGTPHNLEEDLKQESSLYKIKARGDEGDYLEEIIQIYETGITKILNRTGTIEKYITDIFWKHISNSLDMWIGDTTRDKEKKQKSLLRYTLLHIQEYLELTAESKFENYHPAEIYITPPIKDKVFTGDIVIENNTTNHYIVLTPSCDLAQTKAKEILIASIESDKEGILFEKIGIIKKSSSNPDKVEIAKKDLESLIKNSYSNKYHFLPKYKELQAGLVNFQKITSIRNTKFETEYKIIATLNSSFSKDVVARFSYYYSRQGSPDFNVSEIYDSIIE